jgi:hypothetical protein
MIGKRRRLARIASDDSEDGFVSCGDDTIDEDMMEDEALKNKAKATPVLNPFKSTPSSSSTLSPVASRFKNISVSEPAQTPFSQLTSKQEQRKVGKDKVDVSIK